MYIARVDVQTSPVSIFAHVLFLSLSLPPSSHLLLVSSLCCSLHTLCVSLPAAQSGAMSERHKFPAGSKEAKAYKNIIVSQLSLSRCSSSVVSSSARLTVSLTFLAEIV